MDWNIKENQEMSGAKFLVDTNAVIFHLGGNKSVEAVLNDALIYISAITFAELLAGKITSKEKAVLQEYLEAVHVVHTNDFICQAAAALRKIHKIKLPGAFIAATSIFLDIPLVSFDNDFDRVENLKIIKLIV